MTLGEIIRRLQEEDMDTEIQVGFGSPHSYRGYYDRLAFELVENTTIRHMLQAALAANGNIYQGYKGGDFKMDENTECYLAEYGMCGCELNSIVLEAMIDPANAVKELIRLARQQD